MPIKMVKVSNKSVSVDVKKDLEKVIRIIKKMREIKYLDPSIKEKNLTDHSFQF